MYGELKLQTFAAIQQTPRRALFSSSSIKLVCATNQLHLHTLMPSSFSLLLLLLIFSGPGAMSRAEYSRKVFVASKTGYLTKKSSTSRQAAGKGAGIGKIKFLNYVSKKRYFVLTGQSLMYHHDHNKLDDPLHSKVCASVCASVCVCVCVCVCVRVCVFAGRHG